MLKNILTKLNFNVNIEELRDYYSILNTKYQYLDWSWKKCGDTIVSQWKDVAYQDPANLLTHGWAIHSNLKDITIPCPPWNISTLETVEYRNTELAFGIIERLQKAIPYGYRWAISVQPSGGKVALHSDHEDELTVWIPIYTNGVTISFVDQDSDTDYYLESDGSAYLLDTTVSHYTHNKSNKDRVALIFRINQSHMNDIFTATETI